MKKQKKHIHKKGLIGRFSKQTLIKFFTPLLLLVIVLFAFFSISNNYFDNFTTDLRAAIGYGCGNYGTTSTYGSDCPDPLTQSDLATLNTLVGGIICTPDPVNATTNTSCTGTLPVNYTPPSGTLNMAVEGESSVLCSFTGNTFTCSGIVGQSITGTSVNIQASIDTNSLINTGKTITVNQIDFTQVDIPNLETITGGVNCNPDPAEVSPETSSCTFSLPSYYNILTSNLALRFDGESSVNCNNVLNSFTCNNLPTGSTTGLKDIQAAINANPFINTGKQVQVNLIELEQADLSNLETITGGINCSPDPVFSLQTTTCTGALPSNYTPPSSNLNLRIQNQSSSICTFIGNTFNCTGLQSGTTIGSRTIQSSIGANPFVDTGKQITVNPAIFTQSDIQNLETITGGINCNPDPAEVNPEKTTCTFSLPNHYAIVTNDFSLRIEPESAVLCNNSSNTFTCNNLTTGGIVGLKDIQGALDINSFDDTGKQIQVNLIELEQSDLNNLNSIAGGIDCTPDPVISTQNTTCSGTLPSNYLPPASDLNLQVAGQTSSTCSFIGNLFTCSGLRSGSIIGPRDILASIGTNSFVNTGKQITVTPIILSQSNISSLDSIANINCSPNTVIVNNTTGCVGTLPTNYAPPTSPLNMRVNNETSVVCTFAGNTFTCNNLPVGSTIGTRQIQASIGSSSFINTGKEITVDPIILSQSNLNNLNSIVNGINCNPSNVTVNQTTDCSGVLPNTYVAPSGILRLNIENQQQVNCSFIGQQFNCSGLPVGNSIGQKNVQAAISTGAVVNTGKTIQVAPITLNNSNIQSLNDITGGVTCTPETAEINSTITCSGTLPGDYSAPVQPLTLRVEGANPTLCVFTGNTFTCSNMDTGPNFGVRNILVNLGSDNPVEFGKQIIIQPVLGESIVISESDIINIGTGSINDPFNSLVCGNGDEVVGGSLTTCTGNLNAGYLLPINFFMGIGSDPAGRCVQTNSQVNCVDIPVINKEGIAILLIKIDTGEVFNTNTIFNIKGINPNLAEGESPEISENPNSNPSTTPNIDSVNQLSRTGAAITILVVISSLVGIFGVISIPQLKKKTKIKLK